MSGQPNQLAETTEAVAAQPTVEFLSPPAELAPSSIQTGAVAVEATRAAREAMVVAQADRLKAEVVLVTRDSRTDLARSLAAVRRAASVAGADVLFVDLGSTDGTQAYAAKHAPGARAAWLGRGDGLQEALLAAAACSHADVLVVLNPGLVPSSEDAIARLVQHLEDHPYAAVAAPALCGRSGNHLPSVRPQPSEEDRRSVEWVSGEGIAIRRTPLEAVMQRATQSPAPSGTLALMIALRSLGHEIHYVRSVELVDANGGGASRIARARRLSPSAWPRLLRHPGYALRLLGRRAALRHAHRWGGRTLDLVLASALLILLAPLMLLIAVAIRIDSPGPALFRQRRLGRGARPFDMYKFRTMLADADPGPHAEFVHQMIAAGAMSDPAEEPRIFKLHPDPRVTRVGRLLRRSSFDELPQLFNVLRGEMRLVGFRPPIPYEISSYPSWYFRRFAGKPGLTGLWQVSGRNERSYEEMIRLDIEYANRQSCLLDLRVLARTVSAVISGRGAY